MSFLIITTLVLRLFILIFASLILYKSIQKHKQFKLLDSSTNNAFLLFGIGIFVFALGEVIEEIMFEWTRIKLDILHMVEAILNFIGFSIIIYSINKS